MKWNISYFTVKETVNWRSTLEVYQTNYIEPNR